MQTGAAGAAPADNRAAVAALLAGALIWGLIWYPYRILRDGGIDGVAASTASYALAFALGLICWRRRRRRIAPSWTLLWLALAAGTCNLGYVLATLDGEVMRVLLLFYLAPLWTVLLSRLLLDERLDAGGALVIGL
ncbi:MAG TPA: EamA family transporter, partial [Accumulibacter sp.]|uniref:EamA family transporter n=1 Tax=Accumulibacter sp. TaxID=2053492 RepID=UPI002B9ED752